MHAAAYNGRPELVAMLLKAGADPTLRTEHGKTPLEFARVIVTFLFSLLCIVY